MNTLQNLHTHSTFCDGKDTPEQMVKAAIQKGFGAIGFSGHSYMSFSKVYSMTREKTDAYNIEIERLKKEYDGVIDIFRGLEFEMYSEIENTGFDYVIGSTHYFHIGDEYVGFDRSADDVRAVVDKYFGGDAMRFAKAYFEQISTLAKYGSFDIIGHFDICAKQIENAVLFDQQSRQYVKYATDAMDALRGKIPFFEINTGAISRGYRTTPYPSKTLIKEFKRRGFGAVISSDCHDADYLDCHFEQSRELLKECGYKERYILTKNGFTAVEI